MGPDRLPGELVDGVARGLTGGVKSAVSGIASTAKGAGASLQGGVDQPFQAIGFESSPLRIVGDIIDGGVSAVENSINNGILTSVEMVGDAVTDGLDRIPKTLLGLGSGRNFMVFGGRRR